MKIAVDEDRIVLKGGGNHDGKVTKNEAFAGMDHYPSVNLDTFARERSTSNQR